MRYSFNFLTLNLNTVSSFNFLTLNFNTVSDDLELTYTQEDITHFRKKIGTDIMHKSLRYAV